MSYYETLQLGFNIEAFKMMACRTLSRIIYTVLGSSLGRYVKQFTALVIFVFAVTSFGQSQCVDLFKSAGDIFQLDTSSNIKSYYSFTHTYGKKRPEKFDVTLHDGTIIKVDIPDHMKQLMDPVKNLNIAVMGVLGKVFDIKYNANNKKVQADANYFYQEKVRSEIKNWIPKISDKVSPEFLKEVNKTVKIIKLDSGLINIRIETGQLGEKETSLIEDAIKNKYSTMYIQLVNWSYRLSGLEKNKSLSSFVMLDEIVVLAKNLQSLQFNMIFNPVVWDLQLRILEAQVIAYRSETDPQISKELLNEISQPNLPLLPLAGVALAHHMINQSAPVEIKRYFKNDFQDPLGLTDVQPKNEFRIRHEMIYKMVENLKPHHEVEIHAHSLLHAKAYTKLGFKVSEQISNPLYPGVVIYLLKGQRETILDKISLILSKH